MTSRTEPRGEETVHDKINLISSTRVSPPSSKKGLLSTYSLSQSSARPDDLEDQPAEEATILSELRPEDISKAAKPTPVRARDHSKGVNRSNLQVVSNGKAVEDCDHHNGDRLYHLVPPSRQTPNLTTIDMLSQSRDMSIRGTWATGTRHANLQEWVDSVPSISPPMVKMGQQSSTNSSVHRPDSTLPVPGPVELSYTGDEEDASASSAEITTTVRRPSSPTVPRIPHGPYQPRMRPPPISAVDLAPHDPDHGRDNSAQRYYHQKRPSDVWSAQQSEIGGTSLQNPRTVRGPGSTGKWWKMEPHPMFSQQWTNKKLLVS